MTPRPFRSGGRNEPRTEGETDGETTPVLGHPQGPLVLAAHGALHLGSGGVSLGRYRQQRPGQRPQGAWRRRSGIAASVLGRRVRTIGRVAPPERWSFTVTPRELATSGSRCPPLRLRMAGVGIGVVLGVPDPTSSRGLRMAGVSGGRLLRMVMAPLLVAFSDPGGRHLRAPATSASTSASRRSWSSAGTRHSASVASAPALGSMAATATLSIGPSTPRAASRTCAR